MNSFKDYLNEGRDSPLYHGTDIANAATIIRTNTIKGMDPNWAFQGYDDSLKMKNISLTRDIKYAYFFASRLRSYSEYDVAIFELDQRKLAQRYKILPVNFSSEMDPLMSTARASTKDELKYNEHEERIINADIKNLNPYIIRIIVKDFNKMESKMSDAICQHYKLYDLKTAKFINAKSLKQSNLHKRSEINQMKIADNNLKSFDSSRR